MVLRSVQSPLVSAYLKLIRAQEHLDPLVSAIRRYEMSRPYDYVRETDLDRREHTAYALLRPPPGSEWYGPLGDVVHNLRAVLDHAVYGLSIYCQDRALTAGEAKSVGWPVLSQPKDWEDFERKNKPAIRLLSRPYQEIIESEQPYRGSNESIRASHPLHVLHSLWNMDKHRQINFFAGLGKVIAVHVPGQLDLPHRLTPAVANHGSEVVHVSVDHLESKEDLSPLIQVKVALHEGGPPRHPVTRATQPIGSFLSYMHGTVFAVVQEFSDLIERGVR